MTAVVPGKKEIQFNLAAQAGGSRASFKTFVLTEAIRRGSTRIRRDTSRRRSTGSRIRTGALGRRDLQPLLHRRGADRDRDAQLGQHGLRAPDARRRAGERRAGGEEDGDRDRAPARGFHRARLERRLGVRDGIRVRHARGGGVHRSRWRSARSSLPTERSTGPAGASRSASGSCRTGRLRGDAHPAEQHQRRHRDRPPTAIRPRRGRPAPPTTRPTRGSPATRRRRRPWSGSATPTRRSP